ncbi:MAG TPA: hypothetical protein DEP63_00640 [Candidatus Magasanikbacteria bacterium]|nr:hypothetical protein [Candidatus Magasanikbacteria bacterium]HCC13242.1 hypothetical protein [Candidatus Magasanikbacteria bacterium]
MEGGKEFNLNVRRYVENCEDEEVVDVKTVWSEMKKIEKDREAIDKKVEGYLKYLVYEFGRIQKGIHP